MAHASEPVATKDGVHVEVVANAGSPAEAQRAVELGAEGIGLLRTEFLFLERDSLPDEDEQYEIYSSILAPYPNGPVVFRTLDVGGDKNVPAISMPDEQNPFLGRRGIRLSLAQPELFRIQIRAILRAAVGHNVKIMFPLVATLQDFELGKEQVDIAKGELNERGVPFNGECELGIMVEVPSAAINAPQLARHADFFSIGTNDLTQYTMAAGRDNPLVSHYFQDDHPAILRLLRLVCREAGDKQVFICGELAGRLDAIPALLNAGIQMLSVAPPLIPSVKQTVRKVE